MFTTEHEERVAATAAVHRVHDVTAVLIAHNGQRWLPRTLACLAQLTRAPERLAAVDAGSVDSSAQLLRDSDEVDVLVGVPAAAGLGEAVAAGLAAVGRDGDVIDLTDTGRAAVQWIWVLHDDTAPEPDALSALLDRADHYPDAQIVGPKIRGWARPGVVRECGISITASGREERHLVAGERDQGQRDGVIETMAVSSAGMLIRADLWHRLGGFDPRLPAVRTDVNFCERALRTGAQIVMAPHAVVHHRGAAAAGLRGQASARRVGRSNRRRAVAYDRLVQARGWRVPLVIVWLLCAAIGRAMVQLLALSPRRAWQDFSGTLAGVLSVRAWSSARRDLAKVARVGAGQLRAVRPTAAQQVVHYRELLALAWGRQDPRSGAMLTGLRWMVGAVVFVALPLGAVSLLATGPLWFGSGRLSGGALLPAPDSALDVVQGFWSAWHEVGMGTEVPAPPYLLLIALAAAALMGSATMAVQLALLLAPALSGFAAVVCLRGLVPRQAAIVVALAYGLLPAVLAATGTGRLGTAIAAVLLPGLLRGLARSSGAVTALPRRGFPTTAWTALLAAAVAACVPLLGLTVLVAAAAVALAAAGVRAAGRIVLAALFAAALLWPWSGHIAAHPGLMLLEAGAQPAALLKPAATPAELLALVPGGPANPPPFAALLLLVAVAALVPRRSRTMAIVGWVLIAVGMAAAVFLRVARAAVPWSVAEIGAWPGPATLLMGAGTLIAAAGLLAATRAARTRWLAVPALLLPLVVASTTAGWWVLDRDSLLQRAEPVNISPFVTAEALGPDAPRSILLSGDADRAVAYELLSGPGAFLADADMAPPAESMAAIDLAVSRLVSGAATQSLPVLADAAVKYIAVDSRGDRDLARRLDAVPGLRRIATVDGVTLWSVQAWQPRVRAEDSRGGESAVAVSAVTPALAVAGALAEDATALRVAAAISPLWRAQIDGAALPIGESAAPGEVRFTVPSGSAGELTLGIDSSQRHANLLVPGLALLLLIGWSLRAAAGPRRRRGGNRRRDTIDLRQSRPPVTPTVPADREAAR